MIKAIRTVLLPFIVVALTVSVLWFTNRSIAPKEANWDDVLSEAKSGGYRLINTKELWHTYTEFPENLLLVDTRQEWEYRTGHVKGAVNFPMEPTWWSRWRKKKALQNFLGSDKYRRIVFY